MSDQVDCLVAGYVIVTNDGRQTPVLYSSVASAKSARTNMFGWRGLSGQALYATRRRDRAKNAAEFASIYPVYRGTKPVG